MDIFRDKGFINLIRIKVAHPESVPSFVENADLDATINQQESVNANQYADASGKRYPLHTKVATWTSAAYFAKENADNFFAMAPFDKYVLGRIKEAADKWGITKDVNHIVNNIVQKPKYKVAEVWGWEENGVKSYPVHTEELVKMAMPYYESNRDGYDRLKRVKVAQLLMKQAAKFDIPVTDTIRKEAGAGYPSREAVINALEHRQHILYNDPSGLAPAYAELSEKIASASTDELFELTSDVVDAVERLDKEAGVHYHYKRGSHKCAERPVDSFYAISQKEAEDLSQRFVNMNGTQIDCVKMAEHVTVDDFDAPFYDGYFIDKCRALIKSGSIQKDTPHATVISKVVGCMSDHDKWLLHTALSGKE